MTKLLTSAAFLACVIFSSETTAQKTPSSSDFPSSLQFCAPLPDSEFHHTNRPVLLTPIKDLHASNPVNKNGLAISGNSSGDHVLIVQVGRNPDRLIIETSGSFEENETVTVSCSACFNDLAGNSFGEFTYSFQTGKQAELPVSLNKEKQKLSVSKSQPPQYEILVNEAPSPGNYFLNPHSSPANSWIVILDSVCNVIYEEVLPGQGANFTLQPVGYPSYMDRLNNWWVVVDSAMIPTETVQIQSEAFTDDHEFLILENGDFIVCGNDPQEVDMSEIVEGGYPEAIVTGYIIQEMDENQLLLFEWRSWDHFEITDYDSDLTLEVIDYVHGNAVDIDYDEHLLLSSRSLSEITKINRFSGETIWRFGGSQNEFQIMDQGFGSFSKQHDIRALNNGNYMLFDNGNDHTPSISRAVEYHIDEENMQATRVWQFIHPEEIFAPSQGNAQRLDNGNTVIGYGSFNQVGGGRVTEVNADGEIVFEFKMEPGITSYRVRKFDFEPVFEVEVVQGCTDPSAVNYNPEANEDDGTCLHDLDEDGFYAEVDDCDDSNEDINPDGVEIPNDGIDQDCDGNDLVVGVAEETIIPLTIYPNPTATVLHISLAESTLLPYEIYDSHGKLADQGMMHPPYQLEVSILPRGNYSVRIETSSGIIQAAFIVQTP